MDSRMIADDADTLAAFLGRPGGTSYSRVKEVLRRDIIRGAFRYGERLKMHELVSRYGVSSAPIREALGQLEADGLISIEPNKGARVRDVDERLMQEIFEIRIGLEPGLVGKCAALADASVVAEAEAIEVEFEDSVARVDMDGIVRHNARFHGKIYSVRPNREALRMMSQHSDLMMSMRFRYGFAAQRYPQIIDEHHELLAACRRRDAAAAEDVVRRHISHALDDLSARYRAARGESAA